MSVRKKINLVNVFLKRYAIKKEWIADKLDISRGTLASWLSRDDFPIEVVKDIETIIQSSCADIERFKFINEDIAAEFDYCTEKFGTRRYYFAPFLNITHGAISNRIRHGYAFQEVEIKALNNALKEQIQARRHFSFPIESIRQSTNEGLRA